MRFPITPFYRAWRDHLTSRTSEVSLVMACIRSAGGFSLWWCILDIRLWTTKWGAPDWNETWGPAPLRAIAIPISSLSDYSIVRDHRKRCDSTWCSKDNQRKRLHL